MTLPLSISAPSWTAHLEALAEPVRLRILRLLEHRELTVTELSEALQLPQSTTSRHLRLLADLGWVGLRPEGTAHFYRLQVADLPLPLQQLWRLAASESETWPELHEDRSRLERFLLERPRDLRRFFGGLARDWEQLRRSLFGERFALEAISALLPPTTTVLDLGCGSGIVLERIAPYVARAIGVDQSPEMLELARNRTQALPSVELVEAPVEALPLPENAVDAALLVLVLGYLPDPERALLEAHRVVAPGGVLVVVDLLAPRRTDLPELGRGFAPEELSCLFTAAGWSVEVLRRLPPERESRGPALFLVQARKGSSRKHFPEPNHC